MRPLCLFIYFFSLPAIAKVPPSLLETFLEIPKAYLPFLPVDPDGKPLSVEMKKKLVKVHDAKNGYLELYNPVTRSKDANGIVVEKSLVELFESAQIAKFYRSDKKSWFLGIAFVSGDRTEGVLFIEKKADTWVDITAEVLPKLTESMVNERARERIKSWAGKTHALMDGASGTYQYLMPRRGTTVIVRTACDCPDLTEQVVLWNLPFDGTRFRLE